MRLLWLALAIVLAAAQAPILSQARPAAEAGDPIRIDVIARDSRGRTVDGLTAADFSVREDGFEQAVDDVRLVTVRGTAGQGDGAQPVPIASAADERAEAGRENTRVIGMYLDEYFVSRANTERVRAALHRFVDEDLGPRDLVTIVRPLDSLLKIRMTRDRASLHQAIDRFEGRRGDVLTVVSGRPASRPEGLGRYSNGKSEPQQAHFVSSSRGCRPVLSRLRSRPWPSAR